MKSQSEVGKVLGAGIRIRVLPDSHGAAAPWSQSGREGTEDLPDSLASNHGGRAGDVLAQRIKAIERSVQDGNSLVDRDEEYLMQKEMELEEKARLGSLQTGKGDWGGRDRKGKGVWSEPWNRKAEARKGKERGTSPGTKPKGKG